MYHVSGNGVFVSGSRARGNQKNEPQETKYCMPNLLYTCNVRRGMQYWFLVGSELHARAKDMIPSTKYLKKVPLGIGD